MEWILIIPVVYLFLVLGLALEAHHMRGIPVAYPDHNTLQSFTVIINYRNEQEQLPALLQSLTSLNYDFDKIQFIFVNDDSTDRSTEILEQFQKQHPQVSCLLLDRLPTSNSAKKDGITQAITQALHPIIITTDADCTVPTDWLQAYNAMYHKYPRAHFVAAPVYINATTHFNSVLQSQEMIALQMITMGAFEIKRPFMCNGANMSFKKAAFYTVNGYEGNDHISSGDDIFLLEKLWQLDSEHCLYLKNNAATVTTLPKKTWREMILQRARWAQKGTATASLLNKAVSFQVWMMSILCIAAPLLYLTGLIDSNLLWMIYALKILVDFLVLFLGKRFFEHESWLRYFLVQLVVYPLVVVAVSIASLFKPSWHQRKVNQPIQ